MNDSVKKSKRVAQNTILLYLRMIVLLFVNLYTSRIVLKAIGIDDYGIYNVVGGAVTLLSVINASLLTAISRFITFELGGGTLETQKRTFSTSVNIEIIMSLIIFIIAETVGIWFLNNKMVIPNDRLFAANVVYQLSLITMVINLVSVPYNALIVAHEKMSAFAYMSIFEACWKLFAAFLIIVSPFDKLISYGILLCILSVGVRIMYGAYCSRHFAECKYQFNFDTVTFKKMISFAGWETIGSTASAVNDQGSNMLINVFFGPAVNAARGVTVQVQSAITGFVSNFMMALNPQITKSYAEGDIDYMMKIVYKGARFSFFLMFSLSLPILINTEFVLEIWLNNVPNYTVQYVRIVLIICLLSVLTNTLRSAQNATGNNKLYQICIGGTNILMLPLSYVCLRIFGGEMTIYYVAFFLTVLHTVLRLPILKKMININIKQYVFEVFIRSLRTAISASVVPIVASFYMNYGLKELFFSCLLCVTSSALAIWTIGLTTEERIFVTSKVKSFAKK